MGADENSIVKNNLKILAGLIDYPENKELCFRALKDSIGDYRNKREFGAKSKLIANQFMLQIIGDRFDDWFKTYDKDGEVEAFLNSEESPKYIAKLARSVGNAYYTDKLYYTKFKKALEDMGLPNEEVGTWTPGGGQDDSIPIEAESGVLTEEPLEPEGDYDSDMGDDEDILDFGAVEDEQEADYVVTDISLYIDAVVQRVKAVCESCFQLDKAEGLMLPAGIYYFKLEGNKFVQKIKKTDLIQKVFIKLIRNISPEGFKIVRNPSMVVTTEALNDGYTYYPSEVIGYAMGIINGRKYNDWGSFELAFRAYLNEKFTNYLEKGILAEYAERILNALSTVILIIMYKEGTGIRFRASLPGYMLDTKGFEDAIRKISVFTNSKVIVNTIAGTRDTYDIQIMNDFEQYLSEPTWGYEAFEAYMRNGKKPNIYNGLPLGRKLNGEIVEFRLDPSEKFLNFLAAGSGAGKGVLTLSMLAACLGNDVPVFYVDYKPDMAEVFWDMADKYGIKTFAFDGAKNEHPYGYKATASIPDYAYEEFGGIANTLVYLKCLEWALILAKYRSTQNKTTPSIMFVFDECEAAQANVVSVIETINRVLKNPDHKPKTKDDLGTETYQYARRLGAWISKLDVDLSDFIKATARKGAVFSLFIGQSTLVDNWRSAKLNAQEISLFGQVLRAGTVFKFLGKGTSGIYGSDNAEITAEERKCINNHRFFLQAKGSKPKQAEVFKTFLTLNTDDPNAGCWKRGIGSSEWQTSGGNEEEYYRKLARKYPGRGATANQYGMHKGTGFEGLAGMYCDGNTELIAKALQGSWDYSNEMLNILNMSQTYGCVGDFIYDFSNEGLFTVGNAMEYDRYLETIKKHEKKDAQDEFYIDDIESEKVTNIEFDSVESDEEDEYTDGDGVYEPESLDFGDFDISDDIEDTALEPDGDGFGEIFDPYKTEDNTDIEDTIFEPNGDEFGEIFDPYKTEDNTDLNMDIEDDVEDFVDPDNYKNSDYTLVRDTESTQGVNGISMSDIYANSVKDYEGLDVDALYNDDTEEGTDETDEIEDIYDVDDLEIEEKADNEPEVSDKLPLPSNPLNQMFELMKSQSEQMRQMQEQMRQQQINYERMLKEQQTEHENMMREMLETLKKMRG